LIPFLQEQYPQLDVNLLRDLYYNHVSLGKISSEQFFGRLGLPNVANEYLDKCLKIDPGFFDVIKNLKDKYALVMCSNDVSEWSQFLKIKFKFDKYFAHYFISGDVGFRKPDLSIYRFMLEKLRILGDQCIFIDNSLKDLESAAKIGITTIHFKRGPLNYTYTPNFTVTNFIELKKILSNQKAIQS